jgi:predicted enzyme related to lactoylglutathione lyase
MLAPKLGFILLFVADPQKSTEFYEHIFDLKPVQQSPTFALFALKNSVMLGLWLSKTVEPTVLMPAGGSEIAFSHIDVDALYGEWLKLGINIAQAPTDMDFGRTFVALDPDSHRIRVYKLWEEN